MQRAEYWGIVRNQPGTLRTAIAAVHESLAGADLPRWERGRVLATIGMGASTFASDFLVHEARLRGRTVVNWPAAEWPDVPVPADLFVAVSESGRSPETIEALRRCEGNRIAITNVPGSPICEVAETVVDLGDIADAGVYVSGYTATLAALALLGEALGLDGLAAGLGEVPDLVARTLPGIEVAIDAYLAENFAEAVPSAVDCVGTGGSLAAAGETALMLREASKLPGSVFQTDQYLHGPAEAAAPSRLVVTFGGGRVDDLVARLRPEGLAVLQVGPSADAGVPLPEAGPVATAILEGIVGQVLAGRLAVRGGFTPGEFRFEFAGTKLPEA
jgi:glucosamine--fructose-6-phosphate aminotransferase (isomerizing)